jgi:hypothetical protein
MSLGMSKGSSWKRLAVFSDADEVNQEHAPDLARVLRAARIDTEWWHRSISAGKGTGRALSMHNLGRDAHPLSEDWLMVCRGDWPMAFILAKDLGVMLE